MNRTISRRTLLSRSVLLVGAAAGAGLGLTRGIHHKVAVPPPSPPAALVTALAAQATLVAGYDAVLSANPPVANAAKLTNLRGQVASQRDALAAALDRYPGWRLHPSTSPAAVDGQPPATPPAPADSAALLTATRNAADALTVSCRDWPQGESQAATVVPLLGSIGASLTTHIVVLA
ncbi:MAG: hypothetical protein JWN95_760 [Frankiales bacterium]|nr:hypothetical protein [Frankiales bacterium]